jgi:hypothetical protein
MTHDITRRRPCRQSILKPLKPFQRTFAPMNDALHSMRDAFALVLSPQTSSPLLTLHLDRILTTQSTTLQLDCLTEIHLDLASARASSHALQTTAAPDRRDLRRRRKGWGPRQTARAAATAAASRSREISASTDRDSDTNFESPELATMTSSGSVIFSAPAASPAPM